MFFSGNRNLRASEPQIETVTPPDQAVAGVAPPSHQTSLPINVPDVVLSHPVARKIVRAPSLRHLRRFAAAAVRVEPVETISPLLGMLMRPDGLLHEHESVIWMLCRIPLTDFQRRSAVTALLQLLSGPSKRRSFSSHRLYTILAVVILAGVMIPSLSQLANYLFSTTRDTQTTFVFFSYTPLCFAALCLGLHYRSKRVLLAVLTALGHYPELRSLPAVTKLAFGVGNQQARAAEATLRKILETAAAGGYAGATPMVLQALNRLLDHPNDLVLIEVLKALEKVGDRTSITAVTRLARASMMPAVRTTAAHTLKALQGRARDEHESATLLRTATIPEEDSLLTPATYLTSSSNGADTATRNG